MLDLTPLEAKAAYRVENVRRPEIRVEITIDEVEAALGRDVFSFFPTTSSASKLGCRCAMHFTIEQIEKAVSLSALVRRRALHFCDGTGLYRGCGARAQLGSTGALIYVLIRTLPAAFKQISDDREADRKEHEADRALRDGPAGPPGKPLQMPAAGGGLDGSGSAIC